jgi:uncharacterized protein with von Willebrand factor type A (vWA) domain
MNLPRRLLRFGRFLRSFGIEVPLGRMLDATLALPHIDLGSRDDFRLALRALFVHRREDTPVFEYAFDAFWGGGDRPRRAGEPGDGHRDDSAPRRDNSDAGARVLDSRDGSSPAGHASDHVQEGWTSLEILATKDFATFTPEELQLGRSAMRRLLWQPRARRTRRWIRGRGPRVDLRRALSASVRTRGELMTLPRQVRRSKPRPLVLLCDVSGSMDRYSRMLLHFAHAMVRRHRRVEAFLFSTRLTRVTGQLRHRRLDEAVMGVAGSVPDWSGGTRIGRALKQFERRWSRLALRGGPIVLLISDGWDRGDPDELRSGMARLQRNCWRLVWLNPLVGTPGYAPLTKGLQVALPFVDHFLPARTLRDLADLARLLNTLPRR